MATIGNTFQNQAFTPSIDYFSGNGSLLTAIQAAQVNGTVANATYAINAGTAYSISGANVSGNVANANYAAYANVALSTNATQFVVGNYQPNITQVGNLAGLTVSAQLIPSSNNSITLGNANAYWSTVYGVSFVGTSTTAKYAEIGRAHV